jgi:hypothetical protein
MIGDSEDNPPASAKVIEMRGPRVISQRMYNTLAAMMAIVGISQTAEKLDA